MATYYVRNDGSNTNAGTGSAANQAWQTITYAFANMTLTTGTNYLYIAPGVYRESRRLQLRHPLQIHWLFLETQQRLSSAV